MTADVSTDAGYLIHGSSSWLAGTGWEGPYRCWNSRYDNPNGETCDMFVIRTDVRVEVRGGPGSLLDLSLDSEFRRDILGGLFPGSLLQVRSAPMFMGRMLPGRQSVWPRKNTRASPCLNPETSCQASLFISADKNCPTLVKSKMHLTVTVTHCREAKVFL